MGWEGGGGTPKNHCRMALINYTNPKYIYYYTPLPLNLANKQATSKQQATSKHFSFLFWLLLCPIAPALLYSSHPRA